MSKKISRKAWLAYVNKLAELNQAAADQMWKWLKEHSVEEVDEMLDYAFALVTKYGEASSALAAEMYDATAKLAGHFAPSALPAETATYAEVAEAVNGAAKYGNPKTVSSAVGRMTKLAGVDTVVNNALRDGAEWAWIPVGETCAFCLTLASRGWQTASKKALKKGHASHVHANCNCIYGVRFDDETEIEGYDPDAYYDMYKEAAGSDSTDKINAIRRRLYDENSESINAQKRAAYHDRREREKQKQQ